MPMRCRALRYAEAASGLGTWPSLNPSLELWPGKLVVCPSRLNPSVEGLGRVQCAWRSQLLVCN